jgi:hypothetical protein
MMFRSLAYQQCEGLEYKFDQLGWKRATISRSLSTRSYFSRLSPLQPVTILSAFDEGKTDLVDLYLEALNQLNYPKSLLNLVFYVDGNYEEKRPSGVIRNLIGYIACKGQQFNSVTIENAQTDSYWSEMPPGYYRWEGVSYPISARVAGLYNRMVQHVRTPQFLIWETDTIPTDSDFLLKFQEQLEPQDGAISAHYICRRMNKSLAWNISSLVPFIWEWAEPGQGLQRIDGVPHGLILFQSHILKKFRFNVLANDPRDFRGPDLIMGRDFKRMGIPLKINWDITARHYNPDGSFLEPAIR